MSCHVCRDGYRHGSVQGNCIDVSVVVCLDICIDMCPSMCTDMHVDVCIDVCVYVWLHHGREEALVGPMAPSWPSGVRWNGALYGAMDIYPCVIYPCVVRRRGDDRVGV